MATIADRIKSARSNTNSVGSTGSSRIVELLRPRLSPIVEQRKLDDERKRKEEAIRKSQEEAKKYQAEADKYNNRVGILEGIKSLPKEIGKMAVGTGAIIGDIATRLNPLEGVRNIASGVKTSFQRPEGESAIDAYKRGILESQARPTLYEKAQTKMSGQEFTFPQMDKTAGLPTGLVTQPEYRKALTSAMEAPTYVFGGKPVATAGKGLLARVLSRTVATQPEAIIEAGLATAGEENPTLKSAGMNYLAATLLMSGISNTVGEIRISRNGKEVTETKKELEKVYNNELPYEAKDDLAEAFSQGVKKEDILENAKKTIGETAEEVAEETPAKREPTKLKAGEFAPISKEIQETTGKKLTAKETLEVKDKIEQGYTKEEIIADLTTPKSTELTSKPVKEESKVEVLKEEIKPVVEVKQQEPDLSKDLNKKDYETVLKSKIDEVPEPKKGEVTVIQSGTGKYVDTQIDEALGRGVNENTKVFNVKESELKLTDNTEKNLRGERLLKTETPKPKTETPKIAKTGESITAKKLNEVMPDEYKINEDYDKITLKGELDRASKEIAKNQDEALRKAFSRDERVDRRIAKLEEFSQIAKDNKDYEAVNRLFTQANKIGTETAQGLNMLKALYAVNPEYKYMQDVINARLGKIKVGVKDIEKATKEVREMIVKKGKDLKEKTKQAFKVKDAQELLNSIMCK